MPTGYVEEKVGFGWICLHEIVVECFEVVAAEPNFLVSIGGGCVEESRPFGGVLRGPQTILSG